MTEHLPEYMIGQTVLAWCDLCRKETPHRIDRVAIGSKAGKLGSCQNQHRKLNRRGETVKQARTREEQERARRQPSLFTPSGGHLGR